MVRAGVRPDVVGEFEDNALLNTFGRRGLGLFFAPAALAQDIAEQFGAVLVGAVPRCASSSTRFRTSARSSTRRSRRSWRRRKKGAGAA
jgi:hypothetical protein